MAEEMNGSVESGAEGAEAVADEGVVTGTGEAEAEGKATEETQESGASFSDSESSKDGTEPPEQAQSGGDDKSEQSAGERAMNAIRRRESERAAELQKVREQAIMDTLGGVNPFTGEKMKDSTDIAEYLEMREIKNRGGDPVGEYAKYHKAMERERAQAAADEAAKAAAQNARAAAYERDMASFREKHPDVTVRDLMNDAGFMAYAKGRVGKDANIFAVYDAYAADKAAEEARIEQRARELAAQQVANKGASPGTAVGEAGGEPDVFTIEQIKAMDKAEVKRNYDKICKSLNYWK